MSVRTTTVVGTGLVALTFIGLATIFGESIGALIAPPPLADTASAHATAVGAPKSGTAAPPAAPGAAPSVPAPSAIPRADGGMAKTTADGSS